MVNIVYNTQCLSNAFWGSVCLVNALLYLLAVTLLSPHLNICKFVWDEITFHDDEELQCHVSLSTIEMIIKTNGSFGCCCRSN